MAQHVELGQRGVIHELRHDGQGLVLGRDRYGMDILVQPLQQRVLQEQRHASDLFEQRHIPGRSQRDADRETGRLHPANMQQGDLFAAQQQSPRSEALMQVIDKINQGRLGKVYFAARGRDTREWMMKREQLSPRYTTALGELPVVK